MYLKIKGLLLQSLYLILFFHLLELILIFFLNFLHALLKVLDAFTHALHEIGNALSAEQKQKYKNYKNYLAGSQSENQRSKYHSNIHLECSLQMYAFVLKRIGKAIKKK